MKERIDVLMVNNGLVGTREKAQAYLMAGSVTVNGKIETKAGTKVGHDADIVLSDNPVPYVSRGGLKLEAALDCWNIELDGSICVDIGASTGGFTDLMLQRGARRVYAIDVGYGQLDFSLRNDERVVNMEKTNVRFLDIDSFPEKAAFIAIDVSFISLKLILPVAVKLLNGPEARIVSLVKPQFEAERAQVGKGGIVKNPEVHEEVLKKVYGYAMQSGLKILGEMESPIRGAKGNLEFLTLFGPEGAE